ncbi:transposase [Escherichia coli]|nr:transposase [Escherichia coli]
MELQDWRKEPRKNYSNEFKLRMVELASQPGACVAQIARENGVNDNVIFKWLRLWQNEGRVSRRLNRPGFPGECFICELRLPDHRFRWKHNKLFLLLPEEYGPAFPAIVDCYTSPPT